MNIIPAIDLQNGKCVRLYQGDFAKATIYAEDPLIVLEQFEQQKVPAIHLVDLDGAQSAQSKQFGLISRLAARSDIKLQVGGGIRSQQHIERYLACGVHRVVIGSMAVNDPATVQSWITYYGNDTIVLALDVKIMAGEPYVTYHGWQQQSTTTLWSLLDSYEVNVKHVLCTDVSVDGTLQGPNMSLYRSCRQRFPAVAWQASGGISSLDDIKVLAACGVSAAIVGRAWYENKFTLEEASLCLRDELFLA